MHISCNDPEIYNDLGVFAIIPFVTCFTVGKVGPLVSDKLTSLSKAIDDLKILGDVSETLKLHVLKEHVEESL